VAHDERTGTQDILRSELEASRGAFHTLLHSFSDADRKKKSLNPGWTNEELLFHIAAGYFLLPVLLPMARVFGRLPRAFSKPFATVLNMGTAPFNWINALGARVGGRMYSLQYLSKEFDRVYSRVLKILDSIDESEWSRGGMYAPVKWDPVTFTDYMTLEDIFRMPVRHFAFHLEQIAR
jgi:hypothetical protein